jgi:PAS domain S-box-containing protein
VIELQQSAARLAAGQLSERPPEKRWLTAEHESLFASFHQMAEALESTWNRQRELLLEVSVAKGELEATFDAMTDAVVITDIEDRVLQANRASQRLWRIEPQEAVGILLTELAHPKDDWRACEICKARREGNHAIFFRRPEETAFGKYLEFHVDPIFNRHGERIGAVQVIRDLTEVRRAEAEAERSNALLRDLVDEAYDAVYATNLDGEFMWANKRTAELFGLESSSLVGKSYFESIHTDDLARVRHAFELAASGEAQRFEAQFLTSDGNTRSALVTNSPIYAEGKVAGVLGIMRDVTDERLAAEHVMRSDKLRALGQLAWGVAHNFNNSLTAVLGYTQLVLNKVSDPVLQRNLKTVEKAALDAAKMVQRIQNFARQSKDETTGRVDLNQTIYDALDLTRSRWRDDARAAGIAFDVIFRPTDGAIALCDQSAMREVFVNLIINAIEAMPDGGRLTITTAVEGDELLITFADTGSGMTGEIRQRIFEPFYTTKGAKGEGMGLAVTYGTIDRLGGEINVTSESGAGATFILRLKRAPDPSQSRAEVFGDRVVRPSSVLVVDDEAPIRVLLSDILRARGHKVLTAEDGLAGLRAVEKMRFDMVITDLSMPGADGWSVVDETRKRWPGTKLVIVTGYGGFAELAMPGGDSSAVDALISKPFNVAEIDLTINRLLTADGFES